MKTKILMLVIALCGVQFIIAQGGQFALAAYDISNGSLDHSFDGDGKVLTDFTSSSNEYAFAISALSNGKIIVGGNVTLSSNDTRFALAKYNRDGSLDTSFDRDGKVVTNFGSTESESISAIAIQADGKIVVAGTARSNNQSRFALARYNQDGSLDTSFDRDGKVITDFRSVESESISAIAIQTDGKIVVGGTASSSNQGNRFALARYNQDGSLDTSFDGDGKVLTDFASSSEESLDDIVIQFDGKIVVAGYATIGYARQFALARYNWDGSLDRSFDNDGKVITDFRSSHHEQIQAIGVQEDGKIVVGGHAAVEGDTQFALARYNWNGSLDNSFDRDGKVITNFDSADVEFINDLELYAGWIFVAGYAIIGNTRQFALAKYHSNGSLNTDFDGDGKVLTDFRSTRNEDIRKMLIDNYNRLVVAGTARN